MSLIGILITLAVWALIFYILWWGLGRMALGEPFDKIATVVLVIAIVIVCIGILNGQLHPFPLVTSVVG